MLFNLLLKLLEIHRLTKKLLFQLKMDPINITSAVISVLFNKARSMLKNWDLEALIYCLEFPRSILCITETWLNTQDDSNALLIKSYDQYRVKSRELRGGGVTIQALLNNCR